MFYVIREDLLKATNPDMHKLRVISKQKIAWDPGRRGGPILGRTRTGKAVFAKIHPMSVASTNFNKDDHADAAEIYRTAGLEYFAHLHDHFAEPEEILENFEHVL